MKPNSRQVPSGYTLLGIGQDLHSIEDYLSNVDDKSAGR